MSQTIKISIHSVPRTCSRCRPRSSASYESVSGSIATCGETCASSPGFYLFILFFRIFPSSCCCCCCCCRYGLGSLRSNCVSATLPFSFSTVPIQSAVISVRSVCQVLSICAFEKLLVSTRLISNGLLLGYSCVWTFLLFTPSVT